MEKTDPKDRGRYKGPTAFSHLYDWGLGQLPKNKEKSAVNTQKTVVQKGKWGFAPFTSQTVAGKRRAR